MEYKIFGCKVNKFYLNKWLDYFSHDKKSHNNDFIVATCVVTDRAKNKWLKEVINKLNDWKKVYITGCGAFDQWKKIDDDKFFDIYPELKQFEKSIVLLSEEPYKDDVREIASHEFKSTANIYTKKFIVIQNGCDNYCTFCLTVHKRWPSFNRPLDEIIQEINDFVEIWWKEIVLTGINLAAWGCEDTKNPQESQFNLLLKEILKRTKISRIGISSIWPEYINDEFFEIVSDMRFIPHFHFSIQSFSDNVLANMKRNYTSEILDYVLKNIRKLDREDQNLISIWADIILWFPGESENDFKITYNSISKYGITKLHAFPFSAHEKWENVLAGSFEQIPISERKERVKLLLAEWDSIRIDFIAKNIWQKHRVLIEWKKKWFWVGWTRNYIAVKLVWDYKKWEIVEVVLDEDMLG